MFTWHLFLLFVEEIQITFTFSVKWILGVATVLFVLLYREEQKCTMTIFYSSYYRRGIRLLSAEQNFWANKTQKPSECSMILTFQETPQVYDIKWHLAEASFAVTRPLRLVCTCQSGRAEWDCPGPATAVIYSASHNMNESGSVNL